MSLQPLKFTPRLLEKMWGGRKIETILGKPLPPGKPIGESWELYDFPPGVLDSSDQWHSSVVADGPFAGRTLHELIVEHGRDIHGDVPLVGPHGQFPILIKYLDAAADLSVQVHPDADYCLSNEDAYLKSEAWYVVQNDPGSRILKGLRRDTTRESFEAALAAGKVDEEIESIPVKPGDCHYLPSGTVHALGAGILAAEVQTPSDTTFRVFDFNRVDPSTGKLRTLHVDQAMACIDFSKRTPKPQLRSHSASFFTTVSRLVTSEYFTIEKVRFSEGVEQGVPYDQPVVWMVLQGRGQISVKGGSAPTTFKPGDTLLLPAAMTDPVLKTEADCVWLEVTFPTEKLA